MYHHTKHENKASNFDYAAIVKMGGNKPPKFTDSTVPQAANQKLREQGFKIHKADQDEARRLMKNITKNYGFTLNAVARRLMTANPERYVNPKTDKPFAIGTVRKALEELVRNV